MFKEVGGKLSFMRLVTAFIIVCIMINWTVFNIKSGTMTSLPFSEVMMVIGSLLIKVGQKPIEKKGGN